MGACLSCLGLRGRRSSDTSETSRLLSDDPLLGHHGYGAGHAGNGFQGHLGAGGSPLDVQRETEALRRIVARTSDNLIDIFSLPAPPSATTTTTIATLPPITGGDTPSPSLPAHPSSPIPPATPTTTSSSPLPPTTTTPTLLPPPTGPNTHYHPPPNPALTQKARSYRLLLQKTSPPVIPAFPEPLPSGAMTGEERRWMGELGREAERVVGGLRRVRVGGVGGLVGGFEGLGGVPAARR